MRIHQRTEEEQRRIAERGMKILDENPDVLTKDVAGRFGMRDTEFIAVLKKCGYQRGRRKGR